MIEALASRLLEHDRLLVLSGAGCSTRSGIGDYRDEHGAWKRAQPVQHRDFVDKHSVRQRYWARSQVGYPEFHKAEPNGAHDQLAAWENEGWVLGVITQNVDRLHQKAGSARVIDLHGRLDRVSCLSCGSFSDRSEIQGWLEARNPHITRVGQDAIMAPDGDADLPMNVYDNVQVPDCERCGGVLKPDVVFYGDSVPREVVDAAYQWVDTCSALLVVGSSLMVFSSLRFVRKAHQLGTPVYAINRGTTRGDDLIEIKFDADCVDALAAIQALRSASS